MNEFKVRKSNFTVYEMIVCHSQMEGIQKQLTYMLINIIYYKGRIKSKTM